MPLNWHSKLDEQSIQLYLSKLLQPKTAVRSVVRLLSNFSPNTILIHQENGDEKKKACLGPDNLSIAGHLKQSHSKMSSLTVLQYLSDVHTHVLLWVSISFLFTRSQGMRLCSSSKGASLTAAHYIVHAGLRPPLRALLRNYGGENRRHTSKRAVREVGASKTRQFQKKETFHFSTLLLPLPRPDR